MLTSTKLVSLIEGNADELSRKWLAIVRKDESTPTYQKYDEEKLYKRAYSVYSQLSKWVSRDTTKSEIAKIYRELGKKRREEGFGLAEVVRALTITRRVLWVKVQSDGFLDTALDLRTAIELSNIVIVFFDRAIFYTIEGYNA